MITTVAELLRELMRKESEKLSKESISHGPTIGDMYEGLARDIIERVIPSSLNLKIVDGFIEDHTSTLGPQVDAMLVRGDGRLIPYTQSYVWPIQNVIAVFEIKKNLFGGDLDDGFKKLRNVTHMHHTYMATPRSEELNLGPTFNAFGLLTGLRPETYKEATDLPDESSLIFRAILTEQFTPIRVLLGYQGYSDEVSLREGLGKYLTSNQSTPVGFGITSFPNLIICRENSLLKMNGHPYISKMQDGWWHAIVSNSENPIRILIELIWTRLSRLLQVHFPMDDTLQQEKLAPLLSTRVAKENDSVGWQYSYHDLSRTDLASVTPRQWEPDVFDEIESIVLIMIAKDGSLDIQNKEFRNYVSARGRDPDQVIADLVAKRALIWSVDKERVEAFETQTLATVFMPDGRMVSSGASDLLNLWVMKELEKSKK